MVKEERVDINICILSKSLLKFSVIIFILLKNSLDTFSFFIT